MPVGRWAAETELAEQLSDNGADGGSEYGAESIKVLRDARLEPSLAQAQAGECFQFERLGYFSVDPADSRSDRPIFNRTIALRDSWGKRAHSASA